jgi:hypothetical protein
MALTDGLIAENCAPAPERDRVAVELRNWGDGYTFLGGVKGSTTLVDPGTFTLVVTWA